jgi:hypothetical protein
MFYLRFFLHLFFPSWRLSKDLYADDRGLFEGNSEGKFAWKARRKLRRSLVSLAEAATGYIPECKSLSAAKLLRLQGGLITLSVHEMTEFCNSPGWEISLGTSRTLVFDIKRRTFILSSQQTFRLLIERFLCCLLLNIFISLEKFILKYLILITALLLKKDADIKVSKEVHKLFCLFRQFE